MSSWRRFVALTATRAVGSTAPTNPLRPGPLIVAHMHLTVMCNTLARKHNHVHVHEAPLSLCHARCIHSIFPIFHNHFFCCCAGSIDAAELKALMNSIGQYPTDDEVVDMITRADADGSGSVDFYEFVTLMAHKMASPGGDKGLRNAFALLDHSGDGYLEADELRRLMINLGENVTLDDVNEVIRKVDSNGDGVISEQEFVDVVTNEERRLTRNNG